MSETATHGDGPTFTRTLEGVAMPRPRVMACLEAAWKLDALARVLPSLVPLEDDNQAHFVVRGIAGRLLRLSHVLMAALDDAGEATEDLEDVIHFERGQG